MKRIHVIFFRNTQNSGRTLLEKINTPLGMFIAFVSLMISILGFMPLGKSWVNSISEKGYSGIWYTNYDNIYSKGVGCNQEGTTHLRKDNTYSYVGIITCVVGNGGGLTMETQHQFRAGGTWKLADKQLTFQIEDANSIEISSSINGSSISGLVENNIGDQVTKRMPFSFRVLSKEDDVIRTMKDDPQGKKMTVDFHRRYKDFVIPIKIG